MRCSNCGKHLGNRGWEKDREYNEVEDKGWNFCPYCGEKLKSNGNKDGMIEYMSILEILTQCNYTQGKSKTCIKNIKELMEKYGYDKEDINNITEDFCQGFGIARDIIGEMVRERLWN